MPHIHRIRVNNVKYNFGTQFYDDFVMRFDGKNALYDLANGGGKSVLMLLLFQNLIPNCTLDDKQPLEKLFRTNEGSTSIHSLIEWKLDETDIVDGYKYMLTGFCARKAKDDGDETKARDAASIDYFNYVIFYREYNDNDLVNLPLSKGRERMTYTGLRTYLKELSHSDYSLKIHIFDKKGAYQTFIGRYGLYESQWEIIRGINKTEGHVRTYFETNYRTTRKVVEDLLIGEIIQKAYARKTDGGDGDMAETLLAVRTKLLELSRKRQEISSYDSQAAALESFQERTGTLSKLYKDEDDFRYALVRAYHGLADALKQKARDGQVLLKEKAFTEKHLAETARKLDTVKVQKAQMQLKNLEDHTSELETRLEQLRQQLAKASMDLATAMSMRDYMAYEENAKNAQVMRQIIAQAGRDPKGYLKELNSLACAGKAAVAEEEKQTLAALDALRTALADDEKLLTEKREALRQAGMDKAVAEHSMAVSRQEEKLLMAQVTKLRQQVNALLVEGSEKEIRAYRAKEAQAVQQLEQLQDSYAALMEDIQRQTLEHGQTKAQITAAGYRQAVLAQFFEDYDTYEAKASRLLKVYGAESYEALRQHIFERYKKVSQDMYVVSGQIDALEAGKQQLCEKNPVPVQPDVLKVMAYIRQCYHASCIAGADYLKELDDGEKTALLAAMPFLPYAVVVYTEFEKIASDYTFRTMDFGSGQVVLVRYDAVAAGEKLTGSGKLVFTSRDTRLFTDEEAVAREMAALDMKLAQYKTQKARLADQENTYCEDLDFVCYFMEAFYTKRFSYLADKDSLEKEMAQYRKKAEKLTEETGLAQEKAARLKKEAEAAAQAAEDASAQLNAVEAIGRLNQKLGSTKAEYQRMEQRQSAAGTQISLLDGEIAALEARRDDGRKKAEVYGRKITELKQLWTNVFSPYYLADFVPDEAVPETLADIEIDFQARRQAYEAENSDLEDKKKLLETYEKNMERLAYAITSRNMTLDEMMQKKFLEEPVPCDRGTIDGLRQQIDGLNGEIRLQTSIAKDSLENKHKLTGRVENAVSVIEEKYGFYKEVDLKNRDYDLFMEEHTQALEKMRAEMAGLSEKAEHNQREQRSLEDLRKDMERLMRSVSVTIAYTKDCDRNDINFRQKLSELTEQYERLCQAEAQGRAEFEKDKERLVETLQGLNAADLADEIRHQVTLPLTGEAAGELMANLSETVKIIKLEKARIEQGIEDMQKIKENFERQCLQRCTDIKMELDRLPKMSKITLGDEHIQMISLKIPYVKEAFYEQRMSEYIDRIVEKTDNIGDEKERLKYLRNQLAWKNLFSVIVTDMDQIRLSLYKRERIREQSRFLKYEEAVGSTGQSQGIYIQFLIAVINYISAIHSRSKETTGLKKVIFIDNPFGAAKDIYIWEPIFALLKENHVQLIVPARGATPAITGKFDVNYVLGQKVTGKGQQTVVTDYHSNVDIEAVEYRTIDFEQQVFDFV